MNNPLDKFEKLANSFNDLSYKPSNQSEIVEKHPFDVWDMYPKFSEKVKELFDDEHYVEATLEACKIIEDRVKRLSGQKISGVKLMMSAFDENKTRVFLCDNTDKHEDIQKGYRHIFAGFFSAIRNIKAHGADHKETRYECLEHLVFASFLMRKLDKAEEIKKSKAKI